MAYIARLLRKSEEEKLSEQELIHRLNNRIFIFILILSAIILVVDYILILRFIDIIKNL